MGFVDRPQDGHDLSDDVSAGDLLEAPGGIAGDQREQQGAAGDGRVTASEKRDLLGVRASRFDGNPRFYPRTPKFENCFNRNYRDVILSINQQTSSQSKYQYLRVFNESYSLCSD